MKAVSKKDMREWCFGSCWDYCGGDCGSLKIGEIKKEEQLKCRRTQLAILAAIKAYKPKKNKRSAKC